jgi:hypothetical protein
MATTGIDSTGLARGGALIAKVASLATTNATSVKAVEGRVVGWSLTNTSATIKFFRIYNKASAPTVGTDSAVLVIGLPATSTTTGQLPAGLALSTGIAYAITGAVADNDATVTAANDVVGGLFYS